MNHNAPTRAQYPASRRTTPARRWCILALLSAIGLSGCAGKDTDGLKAYVQEIEQRQKSNIPPLPELLEYETFTYDELSLRDPFEPPEKAKANARSPDTGLQPDLKREREALEHFSLGSLSMVGSIEKKGRRWALIIAPDGTLHRTTTGQHIGQDNGEVINITETQVELKEIVPDGLGGWIERRTTLAVSE